MKGENMRNRIDIPDPMEPLLGRSVLLSVLLRSFCIQASWNYERMIGQGFLFAILPGLKKIKKTRDSLKECALRHLEFFNSHPYTASYALGSSLRLEERYDRDPHGEIDSESIRRWKKRQITLLGSVGDTLFWRSWRPLCGVLGAVLSILFGWPGAVIYLIMYNTLHIYVRVTGIFRGYSRERQSIGDLHRALYRRVPQKMESILCFLLGCLGAILLLGTPSLPVDLGGRLMFIVMIPVYWGLMKYFTPRHLFFLTTIAMSTGILIWEIYGGK